MTEAEWLTGNEPNGMLDVFGDSVGNRKLRLFAVACCSRRWNDLDDATRSLLHLAERYCDESGIPKSILSRARDRLPERPLKLGNRGRYLLRSVRAAASVFLVKPNAHYSVLQAQTAAHFAACVLTPEPRGDVDELRQSLLWREERLIQSILVRDIFGNPFRPAPFLPDWRTDTSVVLAWQMYESRDLSAMPVLADALQDAGCDNADILEHCRSPGPHVRGCWVVDAVLGKA